MFHFHLRLPARVERDQVGVAFGSLESAFLDVCRTLPDVAADLLREGHDLTRCAYLVATTAGEVLMEVPFSELQRPIRRDPPAQGRNDAAVRQHVARAREVIAGARAVSANLRASMIRCRAAADGSIRALALTRAAG